MSPACRARPTHGCEKKGARASAFGQVAVGAKIDCWRPGCCGAQASSVDAWNGSLAHVTAAFPWRSARFAQTLPARSEEHTSELQSLMRISYAVFCLKKKQH